MRTRTSPKNQDRLYKDIGKQLARAAAKSNPPTKKSAPINGTSTQMVLTVREDLKKMVKFSASQEWVTGAVNATVYVPKEMAEGVTSVVVTITR